MDVCHSEWPNPLSTQVTIVSASQGNGEGEEEDSDSDNEVSIPTLRLFTRLLGSRNEYVPPSSFLACGHCSLCLSGGKLLYYFHLRELCPSPEISVPSEVGLHLAKRVCEQCVFALAK